MEKKIVISIVNHNHGLMVKELLNDISLLQIPSGYLLQIILTNNIKDNELDFSCHENIFIVNNLQPRGFGSNHNTAFSLSNPDIFIIINPDIRFNKFSFRSVISKLSDPIVAVWSPKIISLDGIQEDSARIFPNLLIFFLRAICGIRKQDYAFTTNLERVDWVAGMFMAFTSENYRKVNGFNEKYFMYLEDADICRRFSFLGLDVVWDSDCILVHNAQRKSLKDVRHFRWHIRSILRFIFNF